MTAEYDGGTRIMEQFLRAVAYDVPEPVNFQVPSFSHPYFFELLLRAQWMAFIKLRFEVSGICYFEVLVIAHGAPHCGLRMMAYGPAEQKDRMDYAAAHVIIAVEWYDNRCVSLTSSYLRVKALPSIVHNYNMHMGGVDLNEMLYELYRLSRRS
ncbi:hypothetical protein T02_12580 [Trichinella nativa]|uniref:Uncharacterized protein n=1 Tax=Trichinella nativa TaxID=6335 RepID=A0A0V1KWX5_9BILA|nr:hypothetical protein T02_12580 [Trichinella nativa]